MKSIVRAFIPSRSVISLPDRHVWPLDEFAINTMTIFSSKKPSNSSNNKDLSSNVTGTNQTNASSSSSAISRTRLSRDDDPTNNPLPNNASNLLEDASLGCDPNLPSSSTSNNAMLTTTSSMSLPSAKRKSHHHHHHPTTVKQARRRGSSVGEKLSSNPAAANSPSSSLNLENSLTSSSNTNEHVPSRPTSSSSAPVSALTTMTNDENEQQCNSEDEYEQTNVKYDQNNLNEVSSLTLKSFSSSTRLFFSRFAA